jgi:hypothetical protein
MRKPQGDNPISMAGEKADGAVLQPSDVGSIDDQFEVFAGLVVDQDYLSIQVLAGANSS